MGFADRITRGTDSNETDEHEPRMTRIAAKRPNGTRAPFPDEIESGEWQWTEEEAPSKEQFKFEYGEQLEPGITYVLGYKEGRTIDFDNIIWSFDVQGGRDDQVEALAGEVARLREQIDSGEMGDVEDQIIQKAINGELAQVDTRAIEAAKDLSDAVGKIRGESSGGGLFDQVNDKTDWKEVLAAVGLGFADDPQKIRDISRNLVSGVKEGALDEGPPQPPGRQQQPESEPEPQPEAEPQETPQGRTPTAQERYEELAAAAEADADDADDDQDADREPPADPQTARDLADMDYNDKAELAKYHGIEGNAYQTSGEDLDAYLVDTLDLPGALEPDDDADATAADESGDDGPVTHSEVQADPEVAERIEADSAPTGAPEEPVADGGDEA